MTRIRSALTVTTIGLVCKSVLNTGLSMSTSGLPTLISALESSERNRGRGIITISNHISTLDDPVTWGILPTRFYLQSRMTRWTLGASDIMFTNPLVSTFFRWGQVIETFRGNGIHQPSVDTAIEKLNEGSWIHLFGEGKVNQTNEYPKTADGLRSLPRFKWGVGRILMETRLPPLVIPIWLSGFDQLMPEGRPFPYKYLPRLGTRLSVTVGDPIPAEDIKKALDSRTINSSSLRGGPEYVPGWIEDARLGDADRVRRELTAILHKAVEDLGKKASPQVFNR